MLFLSRFYINNVYLTWCTPPPDININAGARIPFRFSPVVFRVDCALWCLSARDHKHHTHTLGYPEHHSPTKWVACPGGWWTLLCGAMLSLWCSLSSAVWCGVLVPSRQWGRSIHRANHQPTFVLPWCLVHVDTDGPRPREPMDTRHLMLKQGKRSRKIKLNSRVSGGSCFFFAKCCYKYTYVRKHNNTGGMEKLESGERA